MWKSVDTQDLLFPDCPIRNVLARVGDKWSLLIMHALSRRGAPLRFTEFRKELPDISQKVLTSTLRHLEEDGFVTRTVYPEVPPRVEYQLTERGRSFLLACRPMIDWVLAHMAAILKERQAKVSCSEKH